MSHKGTDEGAVLGRACPMDYRYSVPLSSDKYAQNEDYFSVFKPRIHKQAVIADDASVDIQIEWYGQEGLGSKVGNMNNHAGNFTALSAPECLPERLYIVSYAIEYAFLHDGKALSYY
jgi:hypothetical protein